MSVWSVGMDTWARDSSDRTGQLVAPCSCVPASKSFQRPSGSSSASVAAWLPGPRACSPTMSVAVLGFPLWTPSGVAAGCSFVSGSFVLALMSSSLRTAC